MKPTTKTNRRSFKWLIAGMMLWAASACAIAERAVPHSFTFNAIWDSPEEEILDYQYGNSGVLVTRLSDEARKLGQTRQRGNVYATMPKGEFLYVKWRIKNSGQVYEDRVDLKSRLPEDITKNRIYFIVKGPKLHVYLITEEKLNPNPCPPRATFPSIGQPAHPDVRIFSIYCDLRIIKLYPERAIIKNP